MNNELRFLVKTTRYRSDCGFAQGRNEFRENAV